MRKSKANEILNLLENAYPFAECALNHRNNYELLVAVVLSAQTTDKSVNEVSPALFERYPNPAELALARQEDVEELIHRIGMYRSKARNIIALAGRLVSEYGGEVPSDEAELMSLPGVGKKTSNVVRSVGFGIPAIAVDTHVFRVSNRIGLARAETVEETEEQLKKLIPRERWSRAHHLLIFHGRLCCAARKPNCAGCPIAGLCEYGDKTIRE